MSDLERFRDHCRAMASFEPPTRPTSVSITCHRGHIYGDCNRPPTHCGCSCHDVLGPLPAERDLWARLADEVDAYLAGDDEGPGLFEEDG